MILDIFDILMSLEQIFDALTKKLECLSLTILSYVTLSISDIQY
jgi:hypothetical protein